MTTFTAEVAGDAILLTLSSLTAGGEVTIDRLPDNGRVRGTPVVLPSAGGTVLTDIEYPFGESLTYTAVVRDESTGVTIETLTATAGPVLLPKDGAVLSDPLLGLEVQVTVIDERDAGSEWRGFRFNLAGRSKPLYVTEFHGEWRWTHEYLTLDKADRATLDTLLRLGRPLLVRPAQGCDLFSGWAYPENILVNRFSISASDSRRRWQVTLGRTVAPDSTVEPSFVTLEDLHEWEPGTLQDIADRVTTNLLDLALTVVRDQA